MAATRENKVDFFIEKSESISSWRVIEPKDEQDLAPSMDCSSQRDSESLY